MGKPSKDKEYRARWLARIRARVVVDNNGCWIWQGFINPRWGYGTTSHRGKMGYVHRWMYKVTHGVQLTREQYVCHSCDVKACCNPDHLWLGTNSENQQDSVRKRRHGETKKTHCPNGHEYTRANTRIIGSASGGTARQCRICTKEYHRKRNERLAAERATRGVTA